MYVNGKTTHLKHQISEELGF